MTDIKQLIGARILSEANDIKRTLTSLSDEMGVDLDHVKAICKGSVTDKEQRDFVFKMAETYPVDPYDILINKDDCTFGIKIMRNNESESRARVFNRKSKCGATLPYYEYRDTAMSSHGPFRPEWIKMLRHVEDSNANNIDVVYNNGHLLHQNTFFIGPVNFYYEVDGVKYCKEMNTGDSNYITPFWPHSFTARDNKEEAIIIAVTYAGEVSKRLKDLYLLGKEKVKELCINNRNKNSAIAKLVTQHLYDEGLTSEQFIKLYDLDIAPLLSPDSDKSLTLIEKFAGLLNISASDLALPEYEASGEVQVKKYDNCQGYLYPNEKNAFCYLTPLVKSNKMPEVKMFEIKVLGDLESTIEPFITSLHTYVYHYKGQDTVVVWEYDGKWHQERLYRGDSICIKPFIKYFFKQTDVNESNATLCMVRVPGSISKRIQKELSVFSSHDRIIESVCWFN